MILTREREDLKQLVETVFSPSRAHPLFILSVHHFVALAYFRRDFDHMGARNSKGSNRGRQFPYASAHLLSKHSSVWAASCSGVGCEIPLVRKSPSFPASRILFRGNRGSTSRCS